MEQRRDIQRRLPGEFGAQPLQQRYRPVRRRHARRADRRRAVRGPGLCALSRGVLSGLSARWLLAARGCRSRWAGRRAISRRSGWKPAHDRCPCRHRRLRERRAVFQRLRPSRPRRAPFQYRREDKTGWHGHRAAVAAAIPSRMGSVWGTHLAVASCRSCRRFPAENHDLVRHSGNMTIECSRLVNPILRLPSPTLPLRATRLALRHRPA